MIAALGIVMISCDDDDEGNPADPQPGKIEVTQAYGDSSSIVGRVNQFREQAGRTLNTAPGASSGRREINWDGVPAELISPLLLPADFFNPTVTSAPDARKRGLVYFPSTAALLVSDRNFTEVDTIFRGQFKAFSKNKLFSPRGTNISEIRFQLPGSTTAAYVTSFGIIFSDVDNADATMIEAYEGNNLIGTARAQVADRNYSFVGLRTNSRRITRIRIMAGNANLAAGVQDGSARDIVVMDDLIYSEPRAFN